jgi:hypothetical protein
MTRAAWMIAAAALTLTAGQAIAAPEAGAVREARLAVIVGADRGDEGDVPLRYAELDAKRMRDLLTELGDVASARAILVRGGGVSDVREAVREASGRAAELHEAGYRVTFLFYYSGHGDEDSLHLPGGRFALAELRQAIATVPADVRLVILDACRGLGRVKGVSQGQDFELSAVQRGPQGTVEVRASSDGEAAQESDELRGSVFTHFLLSGLRGDADADGDRRVTLAELYAYAYRRTLLRTQTGPVTQHATVDIDLEGAGELVVAVPGAAAATLVVPSGSLRYMIVATPSAGVIGEITGASGGFALPAGRYLVVVREGKRTRVAEVDLSKGGTARLSAGDFHEVKREELVARGGWLELRRSRWRVSAGGELASSRPEQPAATLSGGYVRFSGPWFRELDVGGGSGKLDGDRWLGTARTLALAGLAGRRWRVGQLELAVGAGLELRHGWQSVERRDPERYAQVGLPTTASLDYGAAGARGVLRLDVPIGADASLSFELGGLAMLRRELDSGGGGGHHVASAFFMSPSLAYVHAF